MAAGDKKLEDGLVSIESAHSVSDTIDRLEAILKEKGMGIFGRVDHTANAAKADLTMPNTQVLIFGNPKMGTGLMLASPRIAIDLPLKMLAAEDTNGKVHLSWIDPAHQKSFHSVQGCDEVFQNISTALENMATAAST